jgi:hypothetical protein
LLPTIRTDLEIKETELRMLTGFIQLRTQSSGKLKMIDNLVGYIAV